MTSKNAVLWWVGDGNIHDLHRRDAGAVVDFYIYNVYIIPYNIQFWVAIMLYRKGVFGRRGSNYETTCGGGR